MRRTNVILSSAVVAVAMTLLAGCGSDEGSSSATSATSVAARADDAAETSSTTIEVEPATTEAASDTAVSMSTDDAADTTVGDVEVDVDAGSTGGEQPTLTWAAVDGATLYSVVVTDADGAAFWGWQGSELTVTVGDGAPDPLVNADMTWSVVALDADGTPLWESGPLPV